MYLYKSLHMESILYNKSYELTLVLIDVAEELEKKNKQYISNQLYRCCTSISANISEANHAESKRDFVHKLKISSKESQETKYWLSIIRDKKFLELDEKIWDSLDYIQRMLSKSISTTLKGMSTRAH